MRAKLEWAPASCTRFVFSVASVNLYCLRVETSFVLVVRKIDICENPDQKARTYDRGLQGTATSETSGSKRHLHVILSIFSVSLRLCA